MVRCLRPGGWLIDEEGDWGVPGRSIHPILSTPATTRPSTAAAGGPPVGMTRFSGASCPRCWSAAACRTSTTGPPPAWSAGPAHGRAGGGRTLTSSAPGGSPAALPKPPATNIRRSRRPAATRRSGSSPSSCTPARAGGPGNKQRRRACPASPGGSCQTRTLKPPVSGHPGRGGGCNDGRCRARRRLMVMIMGGAR